MPVTYEPIATTTLSVSASNILFSGIPSTYTDLKVIIVANSPSSASLYLRLNGDTTMGNYGTQVFFADGANLQAGGFANNSQAFVCGWGIGLGAHPGYGEADIFSYASSRFKSILSRGAFDFNGSGEVATAINTWRSTAAVTSVTITGGLFDVGTTVTLFGIKAA